MKTEELIAVLAADVRPRAGLGTGLAASLTLGTLVAATGLLLMLGLRADLLPASQDPLVAIKPLLPAILAIPAMAFALSLARPDAFPGRWQRALWIAPVLAVAAVAAELTRVSPAGWLEAGLGTTPLQCLFLVPATALPLLAAALFAVRRGAPLSPTRAGAACGLAAGAIAASLYALHCTEDSPLFYATWYSLGILIVTAAGAVLGRTLLRW